MDTPRKIANVATRLANIKTEEAELVRELRSLLDEYEGASTAAPKQLNLPTPKLEMNGDGPLTAGILVALRNGPNSPAQVSKLLHHDIKSVRTTMARLSKKGRLEKLSRGRYAVKGGEPN